MLADKLNPGGEILFYSGSFAYDKAEAVGQELCKQRPFEPADAYKSLAHLQEAGGLRRVDSPPPVTGRGQGWGGHRAFGSQ